MNLQKMKIYSRHYDGNKFLELVMTIEIDHKDKHPTAFGAERSLGALELAKNKSTL